MKHSFILFLTVSIQKELEGQNIYTGCCTLSLQYSNLESLTVKYNNDKSRDFTNPNLPAGDSGGASSASSHPGRMG
jgi:hypothetical protein